MIGLARGSIVLLVGLSVLHGKDLGQAPMRFREVEHFSLYFGQRNALDLGFGDDLIDNKFLRFARVCESFHLIDLSVRACF